MSETHQLHVVSFPDVLIIAQYPMGQTRGLAKIYVTERIKESKFIAKYLDRCDGNVTESIATKISAIFFIQQFITSLLLVR